MNPGMKDIVQVSDEHFEATLSLPESFNGKTVKDISDSSEVRVVFITRSMPQMGRGKKVKGYTNKQELLPPNSRVLKEEDSDIRVIGTMKQIRKLERVLK